MPVPDAAAAPYSSPPAQVVFCPSSNLMNGEGSPTCPPADQSNHLRLHLGYFDRTDLAHRNRNGKTGTLIDCRLITITRNVPPTTPAPTTATITSPIGNANGGAASTFRRRQRRQTNQPSSVVTTWALITAVLSTCAAASTHWHRPSNYSHQLPLTTTVPPVRAPSPDDEITLYPPTTATFYNHDNNEPSKNNESIGSNLVDQSDRSPLRKTTTLDPTTNDAASATMYKTNPMSQPNQQQYYNNHNNNYNYNDVDYGPSTATDDSHDLLETMSVADRNDLVAWIMAELRNRPPNELSNRLNSSASVMAAAQSVELTGSEIQIMPPNSLPAQVGSGIGGGEIPGTDGNNIASANTIDTSSDGGDGASTLMSIGSLAHPVVPSVFSSGDAAAAAASGSGAGAGANTTGALVIPSNRNIPSQDERPYYGDAFESFNKAYRRTHCIMSLVICTLGIFANVTNIIVLTR